MLTGHSPQAQILAVDAPPANRESQIDDRIHERSDDGG